MNRFVRAGVGADIGVAGAQVDACRSSRVRDVLGILFAVIIGVDGHHLPGFGDELHGADRPIVDRVFVIFAVIGVGDLGDTIAAVERYAVDAGRGDALVGEAIAMNTAGLGFVACAA